jgi:hypothetical protein
MNTDLDTLRKDIESQLPPEMTPEIFGELAREWGLPLVPGGNFGDLVDAMLAAFQSRFGLDLETDVLDLMTGEFALALLPTDFAGVAEDVPKEALEAVALVQFHGEQRQAMLNTLAQVLKLLSQLGLTSEDVSYGQGEGVVFDLRDIEEAAPYQPGYLMLQDQVVFGTTKDSLEQVALAEAGDLDSLAQVSDFDRLVKETSGTRNPLVYVNIRDSREAALTALEPEDLKTYEEKVAPFVEPFRTLLFVGDQQSDIGRNSLFILVD